MQPSWESVQVPVNPYQLESCLPNEVNRFSHSNSRRPWGLNGRRPDHQNQLRVISTIPEPLLCCNSSSRILILKYIRWCNVSIGSCGCALQVPYGLRLLENSDRKFDSCSRHECKPPVSLVLLCPAIVLVTSKKFIWCSYLTMLSVLFFYFYYSVV
jgi:hypothetical protein